MTPFLHGAALGKPLTHCVAFPVREVLRAEQGIAECEPGRDAVFLGQGQNFAGECSPASTRPRPQMQSGGAP